MNEKIWKNFTKPILILIFSLCVLIPMTITYMKRAELVKIGIEASAVITQVRSGLAGYTADARYTVDNKEYHTTVRIKGNTMNKGDTVKVLYHPGKPGMITMKNSKHAGDTPIILLICSAPAILLRFYSVGLLIRSIIRRGRT